MSVPYVNYHEMKDFYTIAEVCSLFEVERPFLRRKCEQYEILPRRNEIGIAGFLKYDVCKLHNLLYYEDRGGTPRNTVDSIWNDVTF